MNTPLSDPSPYQSDWSTRDNRQPFREPDPKHLFKKPNTGLNFSNYFQIPIEISDPSIPQLFSFSDCPVHPRLSENLQRFGFTKPTPVQQYAIPVSLLRKDLMACAQTGSGKTAAYLYPLVAKMLLDGPPPSCSKSNSRPLSLILAPTRELVQQIFEDTLRFTYRTGIRTVAVYGGSSVSQQERELLAGSDIIVATPGRLIDFLEQHTVDLFMTRYLVIDEADMMLDMGFRPQLVRILQAIRKLDRETFFCSATFPSEVQSIAKQYLREYVQLSVGKVGSTSENITQVLRLVRYNGRIQALLNVIAASQGQCLVFVGQQRTADWVKSELCLCNVRCLAIHGGKCQREREIALNEFKEGRIKALVATDVASRGLDLPNVECVVIYEMPNRIENYVHRIGRTGRIGNQGVAEVLIEDRPLPIYNDLINVLQESKQQIPEWFLDLANGCRSFQPSLYFDNRPSFYNPKPNRNQKLQQRDENFPKSIHPRVSKFVYYTTNAPQASISEESYQRNHKFSESVVKDDYFYGEHQNFQQSRIISKKNLVGEECETKGFFNSGNKENRSEYLGENSRTVAMMGNKSSEEQKEQKVVEYSIKKMKLDESSNQIFYSVKRDSTPKDSHDAPRIPQSLQLKPLHSTLSTLQMTFN